MAKITKDDILEYLEGATILEINDLVSAIEEKFGVSAAAPVAAAAPAADGAAAAGEPTEVTITITDIGQTKVAVIKAVREITGAGLLDAKKMVEATPAIVKEHVPTAEADDIKKKLMDAGATVEAK